MDGFKCKIRHFIVLPTDVSANHAGMKSFGCKTALNVKIFITTGVIGDVSQRYYPMLAANFVELGQLC